MSNPASRLDGAFKRNDFTLCPIHMKFYLFLYNSFLSLYSLGISLAAGWNAKARLWVEGRKKQLLPTPDPKRPTVWMHCASLGEFEQGRPIFEALRKEHPNRNYIVTFFSPSGYEVRKNYEGADQVLYLPVGHSKKAKAFIEKINPSLVIWIKYEYWYHYLEILHQRQVPLLLVSAIFRKEQPFFRFYGPLHRRMLHFFTHIFVQDEGSVQLLQGIEIKDNITTSGDTRFDRVLDIAAHAKPIPLAAAFAGSHPVLVAGSTWKEDEEELVHLARANPDLKLIIAPHQVEEHRLIEVEKLFSSVTRFSKLAADPGTKAQVLLIDNIGMLSSLYRYGTVCYIGGGFGDDGVHNVLEAAVYGKPVVFGPVYEKFLEAVRMVDCSAAFSVESALELESICTRLLEEKEFYAMVSAQAAAFVSSHAGATGIIMDYIRSRKY